MEEEKKKKQQYLLAEILNKGYDVEDFMGFITTEKEDGRRG